MWFMWNLYIISRVAAVFFSLSFFCSVRGVTKNVSESCNQCEHMLSYFRICRYGTCLCLFVWCWYYQGKETLIDVASSTFHEICKILNQKVLALIVVHKRKQPFYTRCKQINAVQDFVSEPHFACCWVHTTKKTWSEYVRIENKMMEQTKEFPWFFSSFFVYDSMSL